MRLPRAGEAFVDIRKLSDYLLDPSHPRGKYMARLFHAAFGIVQRDADWLHELLLNAAHEREARFLNTDEFGDRYQIDFDAVGVDRTVTIRSSWIVRHGETFARFVSCYPIH